MSTSEPPGEPVPPAVGLDVGAGRVHGIRLVRRGSLLAVAGCYQGEVSAGLLRFCAGAGRVAVDAPAGPSREAHLRDRAVAPKFRSGRCSEIPVPGVPTVAWVTPPDRSAAPGWMLTGFEAWELLATAGLDVVETYPAAAWHGLNGGRWPPRKSSPPGRAARWGLLRPLVEPPPDAERWSHDLLDAAVAAVAAAVGSPLPHRCPEPDGSSLWLPAPPGDQPDASALAAMLRAMPPKTTEWNGHTAHQ